MPRVNKPKRGPWTGVLLEPILYPGIPIATSLNPAACEEWHKTMIATLAGKHFEKIPALARRYNIPLKDLRDPGLLAVVIVALADDLGVPGFQVEITGLGETIRHGTGRPRRDPEFLPQLVRVIDLILALGHATTDDGALEIYVKTHHLELAGPQNSKKRARWLKTHRNLLSAWRAGADRKAAGELH
jgi:hypothetical protein